MLVYRRVNPVFLRYIRDYTTNLYRDYFISQYQDRGSQPISIMECHKVCFTLLKRNSSPPFNSEKKPRPWKSVAIGALAPQSGRIFGEARLLTFPLALLNMYFLLKMVIFHCHVSFRWCNLYPKLSNTKREEVIGP